MAKTKPVCELNSLDDCGRVLREIGSLDIAIERHQGLCDTAVLKAKRKAAELANPLLGRKAELGAQLELYYTRHAAELELGGWKSVDLAVGRIGRRKSTALKPLSRWTWARVLDCLRSSAGKRFIRVKEEVDRDLINSAGLTDEELSIFGLRRRPVETFWYEVDRTRIEAGASK